MYSRAEALIELNGMVRFSFQATKDVWYEQCASGRMLLLTCESLTRDPKAAMQEAYKFIDEPWFEQFANDSFWLDPENNIPKVPVV